MTNPYDLIGINYIAPPAPKVYKPKKLSCSAHPFMNALYKVYLTTLSGVHREAMDYKLIYNAQGRFAASSLLTKQIIDVIERSIPDQYKRGGEIITKGDVGKSKTGKTFNKFNKAQKDSPDIIYSFTMCPNLEIEIKINDSLSKGQKEYQEFQHFNQPYKCVVRRTMDQFFYHWAKFCELYGAKFPMGCIIFKDDKFLVVEGVKKEVEINW